MRRNWLGWLALAVLGTTVVVGGAEAAKKKKKKPPKKGGGGVSAPAAPKTMSAENAKALAEFQGKYTWAMSPDQAIKLIGIEVKPKYDEKIEQTKDTHTQDQLREQFRAELKAIKDTYVNFDDDKSKKANYDKQRGWETSIIEREFGLKNSESMFVHRELDRTRFFFFIEKKLWKIYFAFDAAKFGGKTFTEFRQVFEAQFGASTPIERISATGKVIFDEFVWPAGGNSVLRAFDVSKFHGNYALSIGDKAVDATIVARRLEANPAAKKTNSIVESVKSKSDPTATGSSDDSNDNVLDDIIGKKQ